MHTRIKEIQELIIKNNYLEPFDNKLVSFMKENLITATEAEIVLSLIYHLEDNEIAKLLYSSNIYNRESIEEIAFQTFLYVYGADSDSDSDSESVKIKLSIPPNNPEFDDETTP